MEREYLNLDVYEAIQKRFDYIFKEFDNIYVSFSGGKDSGLLLNLLMDYKHKHGYHEEDWRISSGLRGTIFLYDEICGRDV